VKRLGKRRFVRTATYVSVGLGDQAIQLITDSMANSMTIQIEYLNSSYREIAPYGWSVSKDNNLLLMCYKSDSSIRSYRFDRILQVFVDDSLLQAYDNVSQEEEIQETNIDSNSPDDYLVPLLPNIDEIIEETENEAYNEPYEEAIDSLESVPQEPTDDILEEQIIDSIVNIDDQFDESEENIDGDSERSDFDEFQSDEQEQRQDSEMDGENR